MAFNRMWNYVGTWNPFKKQDPVTNTTVDKSALKKLQQEHDINVDNLKKQQKQELQNIFKGFREGLSAQFAAGKQYNGDVVLNNIDKQISVLASRYSICLPPRPTIEINDQEIAQTMKDTQRSKERILEDLTTDDISKALDALNAETSDQDRARERSALSDLTPDEIANSLAAFEAGTDDFSDGQYTTEEPEEVIMATTAMKTGYTGNPYYAEELRKAVETSESETPHDKITPQSATEFR